MASSLTAVLRAGLIGASGIGGGILLWAARQATSPTYKPRFSIVPLEISEDAIAFRASRRTLAPGQFGLHLLSGGPPAVIGPVISVHEGKVLRQLLFRPAGLSLKSRGRWSGIVSVDPRTVAPDVATAWVETPFGSAPAWLIERGTTRWAIHVHGQGSSRAQTLRGVESASRLGLSSLVISYRNDGEGPRSKDGRCHLGESEWRDLEAALHFVAKRGGNECIVFGWSLGGTMALNMLQRSPMAQMIKGLVLVSPALIWEEVLRANARHHRWPRPLGSLVARLLTLRFFSKLVGLDVPIDVRGADRSRVTCNLGVPVLIVHNKNDWSVPFTISSRFAQAHGDWVELVEFDCSGHTQEWNADPVWWNLAIRRWYERWFGSGPSAEKAARVSE